MPQPVPEDEFLCWAASVGVGFDPRYPDAHSLCLLPAREAARFWVRPADAATWPHFAGSILKGLDQWEVGYLRPRFGRWPRSADPLSANDGIRDVVLRGAGVPDGWVGAVGYSRSERSAVLAVLFAYLAFGWHSDDDLFFVPDHGRQVVQTDHHDVIHAECETEERVRELVEHMTAAGYPPPTEPPDETFRWPHWMPRADG